MSMTLAFLLSCPKLRLFANDSMLYTSISSNQSAEKLARGLECPSYVGHHVATFIQSYKDLWSVDFLRITTILVTNLETLVWFPPSPKLIWVLQLSQCPKIHMAQHWGRILKAWSIQSATSRTWGWAFQTCPRFSSPLYLIKDHHFLKKRYELFLSLLMPQRRWNILFSSEKERFFQITKL